MRSFGTTRLSTAEAAEYETQTFRIAELTHGAYTLGVAHRAASMLYLTRGDWAKARSLIER